MEERRGNLATTEMSLGLRPMKEKRKLTLSSTGGTAVAVDLGTLPLDVEVTSR